MDIASASYALELDVVLVLIILSTTVVKLLTPPVSTWSENIATTVSSVLAGIVLPPLVLHYLGWDRKVAGGAVTVVATLTGFRIVQMIIAYADDPMSIRPGLLPKILDIAYLLKTGSLPPRQLPPPSDVDSNQPKGNGS